MQDRQRSLPKLVRRFGERVGDLLVKEIDIASLAVFRIAFGSIMLIEVGRFFATGEIARYWIRPEFHFSYPGFDWLQPWSGSGMYWHFLGLGVVAIGITTGFLYRLSAALFFLGYTYVFLLEPARFQNHYYLVCLVSFLMVLAPAHRSLSMDVVLGRVSPLSRTPAWPVLLLAIQLSVVYVFGAIAKLNHDWLHGEPIRMWLGWRAGYPVIGPFLASEAAVWIWVWGGILFDLLIVPMLLWRRTRSLAWIMLVAFHGMNLILFEIGIFPVMAILLTTILLPPNWPRSFLHPRLFDAGQGDETRGWSSSRLVAIVIVVPYLFLQIVVPLRHYLYPGNVSWTEEGQLFAWQMKVRDKRGRLAMTAENRNTGQIVECPVSVWLPGWQRYAAISNPALLQQFAQYAATRIGEEEGWADVAIRAKVEVSLNGRPRYLIVHPELDLTSVGRTLPPKPWILPMGWVDGEGGRAPDGIDLPR
jgi:vitamin K-dependent gamma-carboxylase